MSRQKKETLEFRYFSSSAEESVQVLRIEKDPEDAAREKKRHFHNLFELGVCRKGRGKVSIGETDYPYKENTVTVLPQQEPHCSFAEEASVWDYFYFDLPAVLGELFPESRIEQEEAATRLSRNGLCLGEEAGELGILLGQIRQETEEKRAYRQQKVHLLLQAAVLEMLRLREELEKTGRLTPAPSAGSFHRLRPALEYIEKEYRSDLHAALLAEKCNLSESQFRRIFEEQMSLPPMEYVNWFRIMEACRILSRENATLDLVAARCGFDSVSTFSRNFRKYMGTTPHQWKKSARNPHRMLENYEISHVKVQK